jgi:chromosome segregation ATPase
MAKKSRTVHVVELNANAKNLSNAVAALKKGFEGMIIPPDLEKAFSKLENSISSVLRKTDKGIIPREDFADTEKELNKVKNAFDSLSGSIEGIKKASDKKLLSMLPEDTAQKLNKAKKSYDEYAKTLSSVASAEQALAAAQERKQLAEEKVDSTTKSKDSYKEKLKSAQEELDKHKEITEALRE